MEHKLVISNKMVIPWTNFGMKNVTRDEVISYKMII